MVYPPSCARKALAVLVLGAGELRVSLISTPQPRAWCAEDACQSGLRGCLKKLGLPPGPRSGDREGDPARVG